MYELKIYRVVTCHDNEEWCKILKRIDLLFQNWHEKFDIILPEHSKMWDFDGTFSSKVKNVWA